MPPRRAKQAEPAEKAEPKAATRSSARSTAKKAAAVATKPASTRSKRAASSESSRTPPPVKKRPRSAKTKESGTADSEKVVADDPPTANQKTKATTKRVTTLGLKRHGSKASAELAMNALPTLPNPIRPAGQLFVWGCGDFGQFGLGPSMLQEFSKPKKHTWIEEKMREGVFGNEAGAGIIGIAAGGMHSLFIDENGTIWSCGVNDDAALGRVTKDVPDPASEGSFLNSDILCTIPHPLQSLVDDGFRAAKVAAGDSISAAISTEGELRVWGSFRANEGSLGFANGLQQQLIPKPILEHEQCVQVVTGNNHLLVLTAQGHIYSWGAGEQGQLGRKIMERRKIHGTVPERVILGVRNRRATVIGAGNMHSFAVDDRGDVWGWGLNGAGQTGTGLEASDAEAVVQTPRRVVGLSPEELGNGERVIEIVGGDLHTLFLTSDGRVYACGRADGAALGLPADHPALADGKLTLSEPVLVPFPDSHLEDPVVNIAAGTRANAAVTREGATYTWGEGSQGELGLSDEETARTPTVVVRRTGGSWAALATSCGGMHALAILRKRDV